MLEKAHRPPMAIQDFVVLIDRQLVGPGWSISFRTRRLGDTPDEMNWIQLHECLEFELEERINQLGRVIALMLAGRGLNEVLRVGGDEDVFEGF